MTQVNKLVSGRRVPVPTRFLDIKRIPDALRAAFRAKCREQRDTIKSAITDLLLQYGREEIGLNRWVDDPDEPSNIERIGHVPVEVVKQARLRALRDGVTLRAVYCDLVTRFVAGELVLRAPQARLYDRLSRRDRV